MKRLLIILPLLLVTVIAGALVAPNFVDWSSYKAPIQSQIKDLTGYTVDVKGKVGFQIVPEPTLYLEKASVSGDQGQIASFERLNVHVTPMPLLQGQIEVSSVQLVKPAVSFVVSEDGQPNWMTAKLTAMMESGGSAGGSGGLLDSVSLNSITIEQGQVSYEDKKQAQTHKVADANLKISAETLSGPFDISGQVSYQGQPLELKAALGQFSSSSSSISVSTKFSYDGFDVKYAGAVGLAAPFEMQGETIVDVTSLSSVLKKYKAPALQLEQDTASFKGIVSASTAGVLFKKANIDLAGQPLFVDLSMQFSPLNVKAKIVAKDKLVLDPFLPAGQDEKAKPVDLTSILPKASPLPKDLVANLTLDAPGVLYGGQDLGPVDLEVYKKDERILTNVSLSKVPGQGRLTLDAGLDFKNTPILTLSGDAKSSNLPKTLTTLMGDKAPKVEAFKSVSTKFDALLVPGKLQFEDVSITLDKDVYTLSGLLEGSDLLANVKGHGGTLSIQSSIQDGNVLNGAVIQAQHDNLAQALQSISGSSESNPALAKSINVYTKVTQSDSSFALSGIEAKFGDTSASGSLRYADDSGKASLSGDLKFGDLVLGQSAPPPAKPSKGDGEEVSSRWSKDALDVSWLRSASVDLNVDANSLKYDSWFLKQPKLNVQLKDGVFTLSKLDAGFYDGSISMSGSARADLKGRLSVDAKADLKAFDLEPVVESFVGRKLVQGKGKMDMTAEISAEGDSQSTLVSSLKGGGTISGKELVLEGFDLQKFARALRDDITPGDTLLGIWDTASEGGSTGFDTTEGEFVIDKGVINIKKLDMTSELLALNTKGWVDLPKWYLRTAHDMVLNEKEGIPPFTIDVQGPLDSPAQAFAEGALSQYLARKLNRKLEKILTKKLGDEKLGKAFSDSLGGLLGAAAEIKVQQERKKARDAAALKKAKEELEAKKAAGEGAEPSQSPDETFNNILEDLVE